MPQNLHYFFFGDYQKNKTTKTNKRTNKQTNKTKQSKTNKEKCMQFLQILLATDTILYSLTCTFIKPEKNLIKTTNNFWQK